MWPRERSLLAQGWALVALCMVGPTHASTYAESEANMPVPLTKRKETFLQDVHNGKIWWSSRWRKEMLQPGRWPEQVRTNTTGGWWPGWEARAKVLRPWQMWISKLGSNNEKEPSRGTWDFLISARNRKFQRRGFRIKDAHVEAVRFPVSEGHGRRLLYRMGSGL